MTTKKYLTLGFFIVVSQLAGVIGSVFTSSKIPTWYAALAKPSLNPPSWVFGPVWTTLFVLMGVAAFLVWTRRVRLLESAHTLDHKKHIAIVLFTLQLVLNTCWSIIFFGLQNPGLAFAEIIVLWITIAATILMFSRVSKTAAWLMVPYLGWVSFAAYLNYAIWILN